MDHSVEPFTIFVTPELDAALSRAQKEFYSNRSTEEMLRDLIRRGLQAEKSAAPVGDPTPAAVS